MRVAETAVQDWAAIHHEPPPPPTFRLFEAASGSIQDPQCGLLSVFKVSHDLFPFTFANKACLGRLS